MARKPVFRLSILTVVILIAVILGSDSRLSSNELSSTVVSPFRPGIALPDGEAIQLLTTLSNTSDPIEAQNALDRIVDVGDSRFIAVLIELMRANQIGISSARGMRHTSRLLKNSANRPSVLTGRRGSSGTEGQTWSHRLVLPVGRAGCWDE